MVPSTEQHNARCADLDANWQPGAARRLARRRELGAVKALTTDRLFRAQSPAFFATLKQLAKAADAARHDD
jgi:hypothetical protein